MCVYTYYYIHAYVDMLTYICNRIIFTQTKALSQLCIHKLHDFSHITQ